MRYYDDGPDYDANDLIEVVHGWGAGPKVIVRVEEHEADTKNGIPGGYGIVQKNLGPTIDNEPEKGKTIWWYDWQVGKVLPHEPHTGENAKLCPKCSMYTGKV
jgi:hypothetical protein